jgi:hypothetical protein
MCDKGASLEWICPSVISQFRRLTRSRDARRDWRAYRHSSERREAKRRLDGCSEYPGALSNGLCDPSAKSGDVWCQWAPTCPRCRVFDRRGSSTETVPEPSRVLWLESPFVRPQGRRQQSFFPCLGGLIVFQLQFHLLDQCDGSFSTTMVQGSYSESFLSGPRTGQTATVDAIPPFTGLISQDGSTLIVAHTTTAVETRAGNDRDRRVRQARRLRIALNAISRRVARPRRRPRPWRMFRGRL